MNTAARIIAASTLGLPSTLFAQSLFHAPLPPQQQQQQPTPAPQPAAPAAQPNGSSTDPAAHATQPQDQQPATTANTAAATPAAPAGSTQLAQPTTVVAQAAPRAATLTASQISLFAVKPVEPHKYAKQDKVEIIINETSLQKYEQDTNNKENASVNAQLKAFPDIMTFLTDFAVRNTGPTTPKVDFTNGSNYKGSGSYERKDRFTARISAVVTDVKPNGMLVIEARETILSDKECKSMVVSGLCDPKDITLQNTVNSSQLAHLVIKTEHAGDVKDAATKGWLPRVFDAITGN